MKGCWIFFFSHLHSKNSGFKTLFTNSLVHLPLEVEFNFSSLECELELTHLNLQGYGKSDIVCLVDHVIKGAEPSFWLFHLDNLL